MASKTDVLNGIIPYRSRPVAQADGATAGMYQRGGRYGEQMGLNVVPTRHVLADEGAYFTAGNPTIGTGIQKAASITAFSDTNALFVIKNNDTVGGKRLYLDRVRLWLAGTAPTATVTMWFAFKTDTIDRFPTTAANATALTPVNTNADDSSASIAVVKSFANAGAMTVPASSGSVRTVGRCSIPTSLGITGDEYLVQCGAIDEAAYQGLTAARAAAVAKMVGNVSPIIIGPQQSLVIHQWWVTAATTVETHEFELSWWER